MASQDISTTIMPGVKQKLAADTIEKTKPANNVLNHFLLISISLGFVLANVGGLVYAIHFMMTYHHVQAIIVVDTCNVVHTTSDKFLSIALDSSILTKGWRKFDIGLPLVINMVSAFSPSYLRLGGTSSDCLIFGSFNDENSILENPVDGQWCCCCEDGELVRENFTMSGGKGWDSDNALKLIQFSHDHQLTPSWQLGNEPNLFKHTFNKSVSGTQLAKDFSKLRGVLDNVYGSHVELVGPDVTRPHPPHLDAVNYLIDFLVEIMKQRKPVIDAITWHHYNLNGRECTVEDFINPATFEHFYVQAEIVKDIVTLMMPGTPIWITETSDAFGGGAPNLTNRFVGGFLWLDKLGSTALNGFKVIARQSIFGGHYALIDEDLNPMPDFWLSVLHKKLVGTKVLNVNIQYQKPCGAATMGNIKFYAHCAPRAEESTVGDAITIFGYNIGPNTEAFILECALELSVGIKVYTLTGEDGLQSQYTLLNGKRLELNKDGTLPPLTPLIQNTKLMTIPPYAMVFWQVFGMTNSICN
ncbi:heparanase-like isoform X2 [Hetaerina americana]|uniref:heparanase-like isoform X2 n=1 Tax=Hetaerina americana TaxID=62018 RepID=UPI003A7F509C